MSWWGKIAGGAFGFLLGGPLGALIGAAVGHQFDSGLKRLGTAGFLPGDQQRVQGAFFTATFSVMGHIAKADGRISQDEIRNAERVMASMNLDAEMRAAAINLFNQGKAPGFPLDAVLDQFLREVNRRQLLIRLFVEIQLQAAFADGRLHPAEHDLLERICLRLGISPEAFEALAGAARAETHYQAPGGRRRLSLDDAYALLEIDEQASDQEVKRAYRRMMSRHHPDKLVSRGLPEEMVKVATEKTQEIRAAYDHVKQARGL